MERKKSCFSLSIFPSWSNFIFVATVSIYRFIYCGDTDVCRTWNNQGSEWPTSQNGQPARKTFFQMILPSFFMVTYFLHSKYLIWKVFFYQDFSPMAVLNRTIYQKMWKMWILGLFNKIINFITQSVKIPIIYDLLFLIGIYSPKNINKYPSEMKN